MRNVIFKKVMLDNMGQGCWSTTDYPSTMALYVAHRFHLNGDEPHTMCGSLADE